MDKYIEVIRRILELLETIQEGFKHISVQVQELRYEEAMDMLNDSLDGMESIEDALKPMLKDLPENEIIKLSLEIRTKLQMMLKDYEQNNMDSFIEVNNNIFIPTFIQWKEEINRVLMPYLLS